MSRPIKVRAALTLANSRDNIDKSLGKVKDYLESTGMGYKTPIVDKDGYPLPDIDHYKILVERQHAARLLNDRKRIEFIIECLTQENSDPTGGNQPLLQDFEALNPFAIVDEVFPDSPAEKCGLLNGDFIIRFGRAKEMYNIPKQVIEGSPLTILIFRVQENKKAQLELSITPEKWNGQGLIGCHIQPFAD